ncbi:complement factor H-related protein 1-like [Python bivittatus]|uniref:Complement factor H-related protein 1-like n=1 Tax=Python bivittatus TaxID=176946 RepID=A0A9F2RDE4_PYTBI|nr:complement factor H-related protein 1-like [Python bivittatus]
MKQNCLLCLVSILLWTCGCSQDVCEEPPPDIDFGQTVSGQKAKYLEDERIQYKCNLGYILEGSQWVICVAPKWTPPPKCLAPCIITKQQLSANKLMFSDGRRNSQIFQNDHTVQFQCREGHVHSAPLVRKCVDGHIDLPSCFLEKGKNCSKPSAIENGNISTLLKRTYRPGSSVEFECQQYYSMIGESRAFCNDGKWINVPRCLDPCTISVDEMKKHNIEVKWRSSETGSQNLFIQHGHSMEFICKPGFVLATNPSQSSFEIQCDGKPVILPECKDVTCPPPPQVPNGRIKDNKTERYLPQEKVSYYCDEGYSLFGSPTVTCLKEQWTKEPQCTEAGGKCGPPPPLDNGDILEILQVKYNPGEVVTYKCQLHYKMEGSPVVHCNNGHWSKVPTCLDPCTITKADMKYNHIQLRWKKYHAENLFSMSGDEIEFSCRTGFEPDPVSPPFRVSCKNGKLKYPKCIVAE